MPELSRTDAKVIEAMIERASLEDFLTTASMICGDKAVQLAGAAQDASTGKYWAVAANRLGLLAVKAREYKL